MDCTVSESKESQEGVANMSRGKAQLVETQTLDAKINCKVPLWGILLKNLKPGLSFFSTLAAADFGATGFLCVDKFKQRLELSSQEMSLLARDDILRDWLIKGGTMLNYEGLSLCLRCREERQSCQLLSQYFQDNPAEYCAHGAAFFHRFDCDQDGFMTRSELETAITFVCGAGSCQDPTLLEELVKQVKDQGTKKKKSNQQNDLFSVDDLLKTVYSPSTDVLCGHFTRIIRKALVRTVCDGLQLPRVFQILDRDNDGRISIMDLKDSLQVFGINREACSCDLVHLASMLWHEMSQFDGDGVSQKQFRKFMNLGSEDEEEERQHTKEHLERMKQKRLETEISLLETQCQSEIQVSRILLDRSSGLEKENTSLKDEIVLLKAQLREATARTNTDNHKFGDGYPHDAQMFASFKASMAVSTYSREAIIRRLFSVRCELEKSTTANQTLSDQLKQVTQEKDILTTRYATLNDKHTALEKMMRTLNQENDVLRRLPHGLAKNGTVDQQLRNEDSEDSFWTKLAGLGDHVLSVLLRDTAYRGDLCMVESILGATERCSSRLEVVKLLSSKDQDSGNTPLHLAALAGHAQVARTIFSYFSQFSLGENDFPLNANDESPLDIAIRKHHPAVIRALRPCTFDVDLQAHPSYKSGGLTEVMRWAAGTEDITSSNSSIVTLDDSGVPVVEIVPPPMGEATINLRSINGCTALFFALFCAEPVSKERIHVLFANGIDISIVDARGWTVLHYIISWGLEDIFELLIENYVDQLSRLSTVQMAQLLTIGAASGSKNKICEEMSLTLMRWLCSNRELAIVCDIFLVPTTETGYVFNGKVNRTCLLAACEYGTSTLVQEAVLYLTQHSIVSVAETMVSGRTCLISAASHGRQDIVQSLVTLGVNINQRDDGGKTALVHAALRGYFHVCSQLLRHGACITHEEILSMNECLDENTSRLLLWHIELTTIQKGVSAAETRRPFEGLEVEEHEWIIAETTVQVVIPWDLDKELVGNKSTPRKGIGQREFKATVCCIFDDHTPHKIFHKGASAVYLVQVKVEVDFNSFTIIVPYACINQGKGIRWYRVQNQSELLCVDIQSPLDINCTDFMGNGQSITVRPSHASLLQTMPPALPIGTIAIAKNVRPVVDAMKRSNTSIKKRTKVTIRECSISMVDFLPIYSVTWISEFHGQRERRSIGVRPNQIEKVVGKVKDKKKKKK